MCKHAKIELLESRTPRWFCNECSKEFLPAGALPDHLVAVLDSNAAVMAAVLWDFHERAVEKYGEDVGAALATADAPTPDDGHDHVFVEGECVECGVSQFVGG